MKRRVVSVVAALVLASMGTVLLAAYVQSAKNRAEAAEAQLDVLVMTKGLSKGSPLTAEFVKRQRIPTRVAAPEAVVRLDELKGLVAQSDLLPGDTVVKGRFASPAEVTKSLAPGDKLQVTVALPADRALGGRIKPGDTVAIISSFDPANIDNPTGDPNLPKKTPNMTHMLLHKVLVTAVQVDTAPRESREPAKQQAAAESGDTTTTTRPSVAPAGRILVTLALDAPSVERVVFTMEFGHLWLSADPHGAPEGGTKIVTLGNVYE